MSLDASLKIKIDSSSNRNVYTRAERYKKLLDAERWTPEKGVLGMPKVRVLKVAARKKEAKAETAAAGAEGAVAAPAAGAAAAPAAGAAKKADAAKKPEAGAKKEAAKK